MSNTDDFVYDPEAIEAAPTTTEDTEHETGTTQLDDWDMPEGYPFYSPFNDAKKDDVAHIPLPGDVTSLEQMVSIFRQIESNEAMTVEARSAMLRNLKNVMEGTFFGNYSELNESGTLAQYLTYDSKRVMNSNALIGMSEGRLRGAQARSRIQSMLGTGSPVVWRLWHSGISVSISNFAPGEIFNHQLELLSAIETLGVKTNGQILSADDAFFVTKMVDFVLDHVSECTLKVWDTKRLAEIIDVRDVYTLLVGGLASMYPNGYPFVRDCRYRFEADGSCDWSTLKNLKDEKELVRLDFRKITMVDTDKFTPMQARLLNMPWNSLDDKDLLAYREAMSDISIVTPALNDDGKAIYKAIIRAPYYADYRRETLNWIANVERGVDTALANAPDLGYEASTKRRQEAIELYVTRVTAQRHSSWIREIVETDTNGEERIYGGEIDEDGLVNREDLMERLADLSGHGQFSDNLINHIEKFKGTHTYAFVGIPNFLCPTCQRGQWEEGKGKRPGIIPISVPHYFFGIMVSNTGRRN